MARELVAVVTDEAQIQQTSQLIIRVNFSFSEFCAILSNWLIASDTSEGDFLDTRFLALFVGVAGGLIFAGDLFLKVSSGQLSSLVSTDSFPLFSSATDS